MIVLSCSCFFQYKLFRSNASSKGKKYWNLIGENDNYIMMIIIGAPLRKTSPNFLL